MKQQVKLMAAAAFAVAVTACGGGAPAPPPAAPAAPVAAAPAAPATEKKVVMAAAETSQTFRHEEAMVELTVPAKWSLVEEENRLEVMSPGEEVYVEFQVLAASEIDAAVAEIVEYLNDEIPDIEMGDPEEGTANGMPIWSIIGTSEAEKISVGVIFYETPANKLLAVYCEMTPESEKFRKEIDMIDKGIKPIK